MPLATALAKKRKAAAPAEPAQQPEAGDGGELESTDWVRSQFTSINPGQPKKGLNQGPYTCDHCGTKSSGSNVTRMKQHLLNPAACIATSQRPNFLGSRAAIQLAGTYASVRTALGGGEGSSKAAKVGTEHVKRCPADPVQCSGLCCFSCMPN